MCRQTLGNVSFVSKADASLLKLTGPLAGFTATLSPLPQPSGPVQSPSLQVPPVLCADSGAAAVGVYQVHQLVSRSESHHPGRPALRQPAAQRRRGASAASRRVPEAQLHRQHRHPGALTPQL